jgi:putative Mn2+ efflux pump MntP
MSDTKNGSDRSVIRKCYWILCGQFISSDEPEDELKSGLIAVAIATSVLAFAAASSALLANGENWPIAVVLFALGIGILVFGWFVGLHRVDEIIVNT